jgi:hypothetical protein
VVRKLTRERRGGWLLTDLVHVKEILSICMDLVSAKEQELFVEPLIALIRVFGLPLISQQAYDITRHGDDVSSCLGLLSSCLQFAKYNVTLAAADVLGNFPFCQNTKNTSIQGIYASMMASSGAIHQLIIAAQSCHADNALCLQIVCALRRLSEAPTCAAQMLSSGLGAVFPLLLQSEFSSEIVEVALDVFWSLLEQVPSAVEALGTEANIHALSRVLSDAFATGFRLEDKELRNHIVAILIHLAKVPAHRHYFSRATALRSCLLHCTTVELLDDAPQVPQLLAMSQTTADVDLELKQLLWALVESLCPDKFCHSIISQAEFMRSVSLYVDPALATHTALTRWTFSQQLQLQERAVRVLRSVAPSFPEEYLRLSCHDKLIRFASAVVRDGDGDGSHVRRLHLVQMLRIQSHTLSTLHHVCSSLDQNQLSDLGSLAPLVQQFDDERLSSVARADAISVAGLFCRGQEAYQRAFRKSGGVKALTKFLGDRAKVAEHLACDETLVVAAVGCVWHTVVGCSKNESHFLVQDGMEGLLHLLTAAPATMRKLILGCLADLLANPKAVPQALAWLPSPPSPAHNPGAAATAPPKRLTFSDGIVHYLTSYWSEEETKRGVGDGSAVITNLDRPLEPAPAFSNGYSDDDEASEQEEEKTAEGEGEGGALGRSTSQYRISGGGGGGGSGGGAGPSTGSRTLAVQQALATRDLRNVIYAVCRALGFDNLGQVGAASPLQRARLQLIRHYVDFLRGAAYDDVRSELEGEGTLPVAEDHELFLQTAASCRELAEETMGVQQELSGEQGQQDLDDLMQYVMQIEARRRQGSQPQPSPSKAAKRGLTMLLRLQAKEAREAMLLRSLDVHATLKGYIKPGAVEVEAAARVVDMEGEEEGDYPDIDVEHVSGMGVGGGSVGRKEGGNEQEKETREGR